jgi:hypothetical protein
MCLAGHVNRAEWCADQTQTNSPALQSVELFNGRIAMLGFAAAVIGQFQMGGYAGPGPVAQVGLGVSINYHRQPSV